MRASWDETGMAIADAIARRSGCHRRQCGSAILSATNRLVAVGYNGEPAGFPFDCSTCPRNVTGEAGADYTGCRSIHGEANALLVSDRRDRESGVIYISGGCPCWDCAKLIANSGLARAVYRVHDEDAHRRPDESMAILLASGIQVLVWD